MAYLDPATGNLINDDGTVAPGGMVNQQQADNTPPLIPPPPDPNVPPAPTFGPEEQTGDRAPSPTFNPQPGPNDVLPPGYGQTGANGMPLVDIPGTDIPEPGQGPAMPPPPMATGEEGPTATPGDPTLKFRSDMIPLDAGPTAIPGEPSPPKFGTDILPGEPTATPGEPVVKTGADMAPMSPDDMVPQETGGDLQPSASMQLPEPELGGAPPAGPSLGLPSLSGPGVPPADLQLTPPGGPTIAGAPSPESPIGAPEGGPVKPGTKEDLLGEAVTNRQAQEKLDEDKARTTADSANKIADIRSQAAKAAQLIINQGQSDLATARQQQKDDYDKYREMGEKSVWGDNPTRNMVLAGIAAIVGARLGLGYKLAGAIVITAVNRLEEEKKIAIAQQGKLLEQDGKNVEQVQAIADKKLANWQVQKAAGLDATVARAEAEMAAKGIPQAQIDANKDIILLKQAAEDAKEKADIQAHKVNEDKIKDELAARKAKAEIDLAEANARKADRWPNKKAGGGGGAGGPSMDDAVIKWKKIVQDGVADPTTESGRRPLTPAEKDQAAKDLHIPLMGKPNTINAAALDKEVAFDASQKRQESRAGLQNEKQLSKEAEAWARTNDVKKITEAQSELGKLHKAIQDNPHNPETQALGLESAVAAARHGVASKQALNLALQHLGGTLDTAEGIIAGVRSGEIGPGQMKNFNDFLNGQLSAVQYEGRKKYDAFNKYADSQSPALRQSLIAQRGRLFSGMDGFGGKSDNAMNAAAAPKTIPLRTLKDELLRKKALATLPNDPFYATAQQWLATHGVAQ
jgi:hypothetical protein